MNSRLVVYMDRTNQQMMAAVGINGVALARRVTMTEVIQLAARRFRSRYPSGRATLSPNRHNR